MVIREWRIHRGGGGWRGGGDGEASGWDVMEKDRKCAGEKESRVNVIRHWYWHKNKNKSKSHLCIVFIIIILISLPPCTPTYILFALLLLDRKPNKWQIYLFQGWPIHCATFLECGKLPLSILVQQTASICSNNISVRPTTFLQRTWKKRRKRRNMKTIPRNNGNLRWHVKAVAKDGFLN